MKRAKFVFLILVVLLAVMSSYISWRRMIRVSAPLPTILSLSSTTPSAEVVGGWKTYRNEKHSYQIQYPPDWTIWNTDLRGATGTITSDADGISFIANGNAGQSLDIIVWPIPPLGGIEPITIPKTATSTLLN
ncbi:hypothetical protein HY622_03670 [Candidatus Uhrbacteria bacterium]|nr:hypothetical protein [Candidatus Uhrbacteria bacterium]